MKQVLKFAVVALSVSLLAACSTPAKRSPMPGVGGADGTQSQGISGSDGFSGQSFGSDGGMSTLSSSDMSALNAIPKKVYFEFDSNVVDSKGQQIVSQNAAFLMQHPSVAVLLAGHADPRGSQEYNFHLGERRADAVQSLLLQQGVSAAQVCVVSYGELRPAATPQQFGGDWHKAYQLDRRVELEYGQTCGGGGNSAPVSSGTPSAGAL